ncbi:MAG: helix-turn-helix transcriptional regulator [Betaproteobacteria bacterium]|nr:helix-turn-helix transcriptional regulator [Betaproteobacteria bacterium]
MADIESKALGLVGDLYDAALHAQRWPQVMERIAAAVDANGAMLRRAQLPGGGVNYICTQDYDACWVKAYREHFCKLDPYQRHYDLLPAGGIRRGELVVDPREHERSEWYNDFAKPQDKIHLVGSTLARDRNGTIQTGFQRGRRAGPFSSDDIKLLERILPHVARAVQMHLRLAEAKHYETLVCAALDRLRVGVILADTAARPFFVNRAAEALQGRCGLKLGPGALELAKPEDTGRLQGMVAAAALTAIGDGLDGEGEARFGAEPDALQVWVAPLARERLAPELAAPAACAAVFISERCGGNVPWQRVAASYHLTPAETRLARGLVEGLSAKDLAERHAISVHTVRSQLRAIFDKTGVRRQAELVALINNGLLAALRFD